MSITKGSLLLIVVVSSKSVVKVSRFMLAILNPFSPIIRVESQKAPN